MNRLRSHFANQLAQKPQRRLQSSIVADYHDDIIGLIAVDGATLVEVAEAVRAEGEPVLEPGFKAAILKQIGSVKSIRAGLAKAAPTDTADPGSPPAPTLPQLDSNQNTTLFDDDDDDFAARRPRS